jgi:hypothetical protein
MGRNSRSRKGQSRRSSSVPPKRATIQMQSASSGSPLPPQQEAVRNKVSRLADSNLFWSGGVAMALAAYAFLIGGTPKFSIILLIIAWLIILISVFRHNFFERRAKKIQLIGSASISLCIALALVLAWILLRPESQSTSSTVSTPSLFSVEVRTAIVSDSGPLTMYMVGYPSIYGQTASPIFYLAYIQITNLQDVTSTINEFKVAASKEPEGPWEDLVPIPLNITTLYSLGISTPYPKTLVMGRGTYRLATPMKTEDMKQAAILSANPTLESELTKPVQPHLPISGWIALDSLRHVGLSPGQIYFRIRLRDTANKSGAYVVVLPISQPGESSMDINNGSLQLTGLRTDISSFHVKYYGDPFPRPER